MRNYLYEGDACEEKRGEKLNKKESKGEDFPTKQILELIGK